MQVLLPWSSMGVSAANTAFVYPHDLRAWPSDQRAWRLVDAGVLTAQSIPLCTGSGQRPEFEYW